MHIPRQAHLSLQDFTGAVWLLNLLLVQRKSLTCKVDRIPLLYQERWSAVYVHSYVVPSAEIFLFMGCRHKA